MKLNLSDMSYLGKKQAVFLAFGLIVAGLSLGAIPYSDKNLSGQELTRIEVKLPDLIETVSPQPVHAAQNSIDWQEEKVRKGDSLSAIFKRAGLSAKTLHNIMQSGKEAKGFKHIRPGQTLRFGYTEGQFKQIQLPQNKTSTLIAKLNGNKWLTSQNTKSVETRIEHSYGVIRHSLFAAGYKAGLSDNTLMQMVGIFEWDINFTLDIREGDSFSVVYETKYLDGEKIGDGSIIAAEFINQGKGYQAARYTDSKGESDYYAANGKAMRKAFLRSPMKVSRISSRFTKRRWHPILKRWKAHRGVDYAAAKGTPIRATSSGKVAHKGWKGAYGKAIFLQHGKKYTTVYGHLNGYAKGLRKGKRVKQGQIIGYVGSTGRSTGPHLHYELRVNGVHRNPLTIKLPQAKSLPKKLMADFKVQSSPLFNRLALLNATQLAANTSDISSASTN